jgi:acetyl-CoA synthase
MSKFISAQAIDGAAFWIAKAQAALDTAIKAKGPDYPAAFPDTAYFLPITYALTGEKIKTLADLRGLLGRAAGLMPERPAEDCWLPYLGGALDAGVATLLACEAYEACKYAVGPSPVDGIWLGAASDVLMRERGVEFVDGTAPGFAAITGCAPDADTAVAIARELQEKNIYVFMAGQTNGVQFAEQLAAKGVQLGWETRLVPFGPEASALVYALGFACRVAMAFGGVKPGAGRANLLYNKNRVFAFVLALGEVSKEKYALAAGAINFGFPVIADTAIPEILPSGVCTYEHVVASVPHASMVERALEIRGCKIKIDKVPIPVPYGAAFEGELIRKNDTRVECGGNRTLGFEFVTSVDMAAIDDGVIELIGPDIDAAPEGGALPLAIWVEVAGRKMQADFEPILERQIHHLLNGAEGVWHMGQRDIIWTRVSKAAFERGFRLRHYGEILHAKLLSQYPAIVDKVRVTLITDASEVARRLEHARKIYDERNRRLAAMTDESVDTFYSCLLCQSFAPNHVCVISPERPGLCGAYNWLDGKAAFEIDNTGPNQPVAKGTVFDPQKGVFEGVTAYVETGSHKTIPRVCAYSIMDSPMTSCGCFEVICAYVPDLNGVMAVSREYPGETPVGMRFSSLAGNVGGGVQTPGFIGCGKTYLASKKFLLAEGGIARLAWMPKDLKDQLRADLEARLTEAGFPDGLDKIADETISVEAAGVRAYMEKVGHPALSMPDMADYEQRPEDCGPLVVPTTPGSMAFQTDRPAEAGQAAPEKTFPSPEPAVPAPAALDMAALKAEIMRELTASLKADLAKEVARDIIASLQTKYLGQDAPGAGLAGHSTEQTDAQASVHGTGTPAVSSVVSLAGSTAVSTPGQAFAQAPGQTSDATPAQAKPAAPSAADRIKAIAHVPVRRETATLPVTTVTLGATKDQGGTRGRTLTIGGATAMPFHLFEGAMPNRPLLAMEVFDRPGEKYPAVLREIYGELLADPAAMAAQCVNLHGADLISVRLDATHPERGARAVDEAVATVGRVLSAVDVPLIVTGHNHFATVNEVFKEVAKAFAGENLLLNWVEQDNYRTVAGAALAYGHCLVAQSPIDVNIAKQLNILLTNMDLPLGRIVVDPMTGALGYGVEYSYSVMERIRATGLSGDAMLASPMILSPGFECAKIKETKAQSADYPAWGDLARRALYWETATAQAFLHAGADILIMYHPEAAKAIRRQIDALMDNE